MRGGYLMSKHSRWMRLLRGTTRLAALLLLAACLADAGGPRELKFGHVGEPGSLFALSAEEFERIFEGDAGEAVPVAAVTGQPPTGTDGKDGRKKGKGAAPAPSPA